VAVEDLPDSPPDAEEGEGRWRLRLRLGKRRLTAEFPSAEEKQNWLAALRLQSALCLSLVRPLPSLSSPPSPPCSAASFCATDSITDSNSVSVFVSVFASGFGFVVFVFVL
jgi:hypothetical protein